MGDNHVMQPAVGDPGRFQARKDTVSASGVGQENPFSGVNRETGIVTFGAHGVSGAEDDQLFHLCPSPFRGVQDGSPFPFHG